MTKPQSKLRRSALYTPGSNPAILLKAARSAADVLILDLEDAVAPDMKVQARQAVVRTLADPAFAGRTVVVRVNGISTPWCKEDLCAIAQTNATAILFPKISCEANVKEAETMLSFYGVPKSTELWCMIETPLAILNAQSIGQLAEQDGSRMTTWVLGTNDLVKDLRAQHTPTREGLIPCLNIALLAARAYGLSILDGVPNDIKDIAALEATCMQGRQLGFDGRTLIHPSQIETCHRAYSPSEKEVREAREILEGFALPENRDKGVIQLNGKMVELLHAEIAQQTVAIALAIEVAEQQQQERMSQPQRAPSGNAALAI